MSIRKTIQIGEKIIRQRAHAVKNVRTKEMQRIVTDLIDSMRHNNLVGMAAPQIGKQIRIFVSEVRPTIYRKNIVKTDSLRIFINPKIISRSQKRIRGYEGCGSVASAQLFGLVTRPASIVCEALDKDGNRFRIKATGLIARIIQHEIDHLNGIVFIDRIKDTKTMIDKRNYINSQK